jgi:hypothetical protein
VFEIPRLSQDFRIYAQYPRISKSKNFVLSNNK